MVKRESQLSSLHSLGRSCLVSISTKSECTQVGGSVCPACTVKVMFIGFLGWLLCLWQVGLASPCFRFIHVSGESNVIYLKSLIGLYAHMIMPFEKINMG